MGWTDRFWTASSWALDTTLHLAADVMDTCGTLACTMGGVAFAVSDVLTQQNVSASYYGAVRAVGDIDLGINLTNLNYAFNESLPIAYSDSMNKGTSYNLTDYIRPGMMRTAGLACIASGALFRALGANINKWQQYREDRRYYETDHGIKIASPQLKEYVLTSAAVLSGSIANAATSTAVAASAFYLLGGTTPDITYPPNGKNNVSGPYYNGPVITVPFAVKISLNDSYFSIPLPLGGTLDVLLKKVVDVAANATYGGGFFLKPKEVDQSSGKSMLIIKDAGCAVVGTSAFLVKNFFANKADRLYHERLNPDKTRTTYFEDIEF